MIVEVEVVDNPQAKSRARKMRRDVMVGSCVDHVHQANVFCFAMVAGKVVDNHHASRCRWQPRYLFLAHAVWTLGARVLFSVRWSQDTLNIGTNELQTCLDSGDRR